jgi:hypothetical protein
MDSNYVFNPFLYSSCMDGYVCMDGCVVLVKNIDE